MKEKEEETFSAGSEVRGENIPPVQRLKRELKYQGTILKMYEDTVNVNGHEAKWDSSIMMVRLQLWLSTMTGNSLWCASTGMHWTVIRWKFRRGSWIIRESL